MKVLAIDTVTEMCSAALYADGGCIDRSQLAVNRHSGLIVTMVDELLAEAELSLSQLDLIVNDVGPGSFTGIRIGLGVAQGLAYGADLPLLGVDALHTLAVEGSRRTSGDIVAMIDARMGQIYWAHYLQGAQGPALKDELHLSQPEGPAQIDESVFVLGSGWDSYAQRLNAEMNIAGYAESQFPLARHGLTLGLQRPPEDWREAGALSPVYLRNDVAKVGKNSSLA